MKYFSLVFLVLFACNNGSKIQSGVFTPDFSAGQHVIVYKTKADFKNNVPVILSGDKTKIVSYPDPSDVKTDGGYPVPSELENGYLLDNRGININSAFLKITYQEYANMEKAPDVSNLYKMIIERSPFTEMIDCGNKNSFKNAKDELNMMIRSGQLRKKCKIII